MNASCGGMEPSSATDPAVVGMSLVLMLSLSSTGIPKSGLSGLPCMWPPAVERARFLFSVGVDEDLDELFRCDEPFFERVLQFIGRGFDEVQRTVRAPAAAVIIV
jgi:hypothetical protein